jgi:hypothetical protein
VRVRLREAYSDEKLAEIYATPHQHTAWADHIVRVGITSELCRALVGRVTSAADLSCGDAAIVKSLTADRLYLGDYAPGYEFTGPIEQTVWAIPHVDVFVCTETLEHVDDPDRVLASIRQKTGALVLSTPVDCWQDHNPEHYWAWSRTDVEEMLTAAGFDVRLYAELDCRPGGGEYAFGIWGCR